MFFIGNNYGSVKKMSRFFTVQKGSKWNQK